MLYLQRNFALPVSAFIYFCKDALSFFNKIKNVNKQRIKFY